MANANRSGRTRRNRRLKQKCERCGGDIACQRHGANLRVYCIACGRTIQDEPVAGSLPYRVPVQVAPDLERPPPLAEPRLTNAVHRYVDLRRRGYTNQEIRKRAGWPKTYPKSLFAEATRRNLPGSEPSAEAALRNWMLEAFDAGVPPAQIAATCALPDDAALGLLQRTLDTACHDDPRMILGRSPKRDGGRVSIRQPDGTITHRAIDGAFPPGTDLKTAHAEAVQVMSLLVYSSRRPEQRDRAYTMLKMVEANLHCFDEVKGRQLVETLAAQGLDQGTQRVFVMAMHPDAEVQKLLIKRCGLPSRALRGNQGRTLSRAMRAREFTRAEVREIVQYTGADVNKYYMIGPGYRLPEPRNRPQLIQDLQAMGFTNPQIRSSLSVLGIPPHGRHPPKRKQSEPKRRRRG